MNPVKTCVLLEEEEEEEEERVCSRPARNVGSPRGEFNANNAVEGGGIRARSLYQYEPSTPYNM